MFKAYLLACMQNASGVFLDQWVSDILGGGGERMGTVGASVARDRISRGEALYHGLLSTVIICGTDSARI